MRGFVERVDETAGLVFRRHATADGLLSEAGRMEVAASIGERHGFRVPRIVDIDEVNRLLVTELLEGFQSTSAVRLPRHASVEQVSRLGGILRTIHDASWRHQGELTPLFHGDYDLHNTGYGAGGVPAIIDWDPAPSLANTRLTAQQRDIGLLMFSTAAWAVVRGSRMSWCADLLLSVLAGYTAGRRANGEGQAILEAARTVSRELWHWRHLPHRAVPVRSFYWSVRGVVQYLFTAPYIEKAFQ